MVQRSPHPAFERKRTDHPSTARPRGLLQSWSIDAHLFVRSDVYMFSQMERDSETISILGKSENTGEEKDLLLRL